MAEHDRHGAKQPHRFDPARAARLDDPARFEYLPLDDVLTLLDPPHGARLVDFGTGTGTYAIEIARRRPDLEVIALDEQPEMLDLLRAKLEAASVPNLTPAGVDALARLRGHVDRVLALNVLHELGDAALRDLQELLTHDGRVAFIDWNAEVDRPVGPARDHVHAPGEARVRLESSGLCVVAERRFRYHYALVARRGAVVACRGHSDGSPTPP